MPTSFDTDRTQVPTRTNSAEHLPRAEQSVERLDTLTEKLTNMSNLEGSHYGPVLGRHGSRLQYEDRFDDEEVVEGETINSSGEEDLEKGAAGEESKKAEESKKKKKKEEKDPNLIEWDGPDDPENPMNWAPRKKWIVTVMLGIMTFCVTFASSVFSNATVPVAELYHVSTEVTTLGTSLFVLGFAFGPLVSNNTLSIQDSTNKHQGLGARIGTLWSKSPPFLRLLLFRHLPNSRRGRAKPSNDHAHTVLRWLFRFSSSRNCGRCTCRLLWPS